MSRAPPFPTRRRSPPPSARDLYSSQPASAPGNSSVRPLHPSRPASRPTTPNYNGYPNNPHTPPKSAPIGPSRPQRSELRARNDPGNEEMPFVSSPDHYRDSVSTTKSDMSGQLRSQQRDIIPSNNNSRPRPNRIPSGSTDDGEATPASLATVMSAFHSAGSRRRAMTNGSDDFEYQKQRQEEIEAEKARQQRLTEKVIRRKGTTRTGDIDAVLDEIKDGWEFVIEPEFNNVDLALQLLDDTSMGKDMESFRRTKHMLSKALKGSVDKHYLAFAASLPHHSSLLNHLTITQSQVTEARTLLVESKEALGNRRQDLVQLWSRGQMLEEMIKILDEIEHLKSVPDLLETLISEKRLLQAAVLLIRSLKIINKPDLMEIGAVADLRSYLVAQETALRDILVDELQSHLYLKSFWTESRWVAYSPGQQTLPIPEFESEFDEKPKISTPSSPTSPSYRQTRLTRFLGDLSMRANEPPIDLNEQQTAGSSSVLPPSSSSLNHLSPNNNPEADSFAYMEILLESLAVLCKLGSALDNVAQRLSGEVFSLVETTLDEVGERAEYTKRQNAGNTNESVGKSDSVYLYVAGGKMIPLVPVASGKVTVKASTLRLAALESTAKHTEYEVLKDLFWTLYSKLDAVAQGLRVVSEVANRIGSRRDFKDTSGSKPGSFFPLSEVWNPVQAEVQTLIQDYTTDEQRGLVSGRNPISSINEILRDGKFSRDKGKSVFRFTDTDIKSVSKYLKPHEEGLTRVLKDTMPGLVQGNTGDILQNALANPTDDRLLGMDQHHRLLIKPDTFHVTVLFQPTLAFLDRVVDVLPSGIESARASSSVLDEFVLKIYLPQLEEKVLDLFHQAVTGPESFQPDPLSTQLSPEPLIKAGTQLMALINSLCIMLRTTPFHRENYARLILAVVIQFYQRCSDRYHALTAIPASSPASESSVALGAQWAQRPEFTFCLTELLSTPQSNQSKLQQLCRQQTNIELELLGRKNIIKEDLIPSVRNLSALASLYRSVAWFVQELQALKANSDDSILSPTSPNPLDTLTAQTPFTPLIPILPLTDDNAELQLPLSKEMAMRFQALLKTYEQLSGLILDTLRIDLRCRVMYNLEAAMRHGNYALTYEVTEPDPFIVDLNTELVQCDDITFTSLPHKERHYVFTGLGLLMEQMLISNARLLRLPNDYGIKKMMRNMLALQQSIKTLTNDQQHTEFERAKQYYSLYYLKPQELLDKVRERQIFTFDEYKVMLSFQCGINPAEGDAGVAKATDRNYNMYVIELHGLEMDNT